jgi:hypothetical protein
MAARQAGKAAAAEVQQAAQRRRLDASFGTAAAGDSAATGRAAAAAPAGQHATSPVLAALPDSSVEETPVAQVKRGSKAGRRRAQLLDSASRDPEAAAAAGGHAKKRAR